MIFLAVMAGPVPAIPIAPGPPQPGCSRPTRKCNRATNVRNYILRMADPNKYRDEAERLRREAAENDSHDVRGTMLDIAELYYRLAETLEKQRREPKTG